MFCRPVLYYESGCGGFKGKQTHPPWTGQAGRWEEEEEVVVVVVVVVEVCRSNILTLIYQKALLCCLSRPSEI